MGLFSARTLILGGLAAGAVYAMRNKQTVMGLLGGGGQGSPEPAPVSEPAPTRAEPAPPPPLANVDVSGPPANTATAVPAPEPLVHEPAGGIDEEAEEAAAAAEAANIGGTPEAYPSEEDPTLPADEAIRPLEEAGEGYAEGQELAEADLIDNAEPAAGDPLEGGRALDEAIERQDEPGAGETLDAEREPVPNEQPTAPMPAIPGGEPLDAPPPSGDPAEDVPPPVEDTPEAAAVTPSGTAMPEESPGPAEKPADEKSSAVWQIEEDDGDADKPA